MKHFKEWLEESNRIERYNENPYKGSEETVYPKNKDGTHEWVNHKVAEKFTDSHQHGLAHKQLQRRIDRLHDMKNVKKVRYDGGAASDVVGYVHRKTGKVLGTYDPDGEEAKLYK